MYGGGLGVIMFGIVGRVGRKTPSALRAPPPPPNWPGGGEKGQTRRAEDGGSGHPAICHQTSFSRTDKSQVEHPGADGAREP